MVSHKQRMGPEGLSRITIWQQRAKNPRPELKNAYTKGRIGSARKSRPEWSKGAKGNGECKKSQDPAATPSVIDFAIPPSLDLEIYVF